MAMKKAPHVLIFPLPFQGPISSMLKLAELLCLQHIKVTFLNTQHIQQRLSECTNTEIYFQKYPNFSFMTLPDGLSEDNPRTALQFSELMESIQAVAAPLFRDMVTCGVYGPESEDPLTCLIADGILTFATDVATQIGVSLLYFDTISPCGLWTYLCLPKIFEAGEIPFKDDNLDEAVINAPGLEGHVIRRRDLPSFCRAIDFKDPQVRLVVEEINNIPTCQGLILNTFRGLDGPVLSQIQNTCRNIYAVGPLHAHLKTRLEADTGSEFEPINSNSIWKEDRGCISWLDQQPSRSVIYVSIGSLSTMTKDQCFEIWHGLVNSGSRFLWVQRPGSVIEFDPASDNIPVELSRGTKERGCIVSWTRQPQVLAHPAIGGFFTHSGWNSTLESIAEGKPMICWPHYVDQLVNSRFVEKVWKIGLDMKDSCNRVTIEKMIKEIMELRKDDKLLKRGQEMAKLAKSSVTKGGSSFEDLDRLIQDIKMMNISTKPT